MAITTRKKRYASPPRNVHKLRRERPVQFSPNGPQKNHATYIVWVSAMVLFAFIVAAVSMLESVDTLFSGSGTTATSTVSPRHSNAVLKWLGV